MYTIRGVELLRPTDRPRRLLYHRHKCSNPQQNTVNVHATVYAINNVDTSYNEIRSYPTCYWDVCVCVCVCVCVRVFNNTCGSQLDLNAAAHSGSVAASAILCKWP